MICKYCKKEIPEESIFCMVCGERVAKKKREKKPEIKVPKPRQLKSGAWNIELRAEGESVTEPTPEACTARAQAIRAGFIKQEKAPPKLMLKTLLRDYIDSVGPVLSPSTISGYESIYEHRFKNYLNEDVNSIDWQALVNDDLKDVKPKTVHNDWGLITAAFGHAKLPVPTPKLPTVPKAERDFFDYEQIKIFLEAVKGRKCELACLLALHSLRMSEILALKKESVSGGYILVRDAVVRNKDNQYVPKDTGKTYAAVRDVPVMIPRLADLWPGENDPAPAFQKHSAANSMLADVCEKAGLPVLTMHELRHSFASLAFHLKWDVLTTCQVGGWKDIGTVQKIYTHLSRKDLNENIEKMKAFYSPPQSDENTQNTNEITNDSTEVPK